jgi:signal transduction histidine kinase
MLKTVDVSGIKTNFYLRGSRKNMEEMVFDIIKKVSTELVTNTLKHSGATSLFLSIIFEEERVVISQMDNGRGVESLKKGNGLSGIDGRLSLVDGIARYTSSAGEGFNANILIPLR